MCSLSGWLLLCACRQSWIPQGMGYSLYIRPTCISTEPRLGVGPAQHVKLYVILCPVGPYYKEGFNPIKLYADPKNVRAWPGGTGHIKCGGYVGSDLRRVCDTCKHNSHFNGAETTP